MVKLFPFKGVLYNTKKVKRLDRVMAPPYDIISKEDQDAYYEMSDINIIRLILGQEFKEDNEYNNKYLRAAAFLKGWLHHEVIKEDEKPALYFYEQRFSIKGKKYTRQGFIALLRLEELNRGKIFPHEDTLSRPKLDRLELLRATSANLENIFTIYSDEKLKTIRSFKKLLRRKPTIEVRPCLPARAGLPKGKDGASHRLWRIDSKPVISKIMKEMKDKAVFIADGHHRYEASLNYRKEMRQRHTRFSEDESYNHIMAYFTPIEGEGLAVFPIHRVIKLPPQFDFQRFQEEIGIYFEIENFPYSKRTEKNVRAKVLKELEKRGAFKHVFLLSLKDSRQYQLLTLRNEAMVSELLPEGKSPAYKNLDVTILHSIVIQHILNAAPERDITFVKDTDQALDMVLKGEGDIAILLNPTKLKEIIEVAGASEKMPQKSTYFYPKLLSGMVMNRIAFNEKISFDEKNPEG